MTAEYWIIGALFTTVQTGFWFWIRGFIAKSNEIEKSLNEFRLEVANEYVKQSQLDKHMDAIEKTLDEIKGMISKLADKR